MKSFFGSGYAGLGIIYVKRWCHTKTTLYIDRKLLEEAKWLLGTGKMTEAVNKAPEDFVRQSKLKRVANRIGNTDLALSRSELEEMREDESQVSG